jgi:hypothetical protein
MIRRPTIKPPTPAPLQQTIPNCRCGAPGEYGYRDQQGRMRWFCASHRLATYWADARKTPSTEEVKHVEKQRSFNRLSERVDAQARHSADANPQLDLWSDGAVPVAGSSPVHPGGQVHYCHCGAVAPFGDGPRGDLHLVRDHPERITWYCAKHRPFRDTDDD